MNDSSTRSPPGLDGRLTATLPDGVRLLPVRDTMGNRYTEFVGQSLATAVHSIGGSVQPVAMTNATAAAAHMNSSLRPVTTSSSFSCRPTADQPHALPAAVSRVRGGRSASPCAVVGLKEHVLQ